MVAASAHRVICRHITLSIHMSLLLIRSSFVAFRPASGHVSCLSTTPVLAKKVAGRYWRTPRGNFALTYEMSKRPFEIAHTKSWNSFNTSNLLDGLRKAECAAEDFFIRKFMAGTWHKLFLSEIIIKRRGNVIFIGGIVLQALMPRKMYFLVGYTEEILSYILKCPVKLELQTVAEAKDVVFKYV